MQCLVDEKNVIFFLVLFFFLPFEKWRHRRTVKRRKIRRFGNLEWLSPWCMSERLLLFELFLSVTLWFIVGRCIEIYHRGLCLNKDKLDSMRAFSREKIFRYCHKWFHIYIYTCTTFERQERTCRFKSRVCKYNSLFFFERVNFAGRCRFRESSVISKQQTSNLFFTQKICSTGMITLMPRVGRSLE